MLRLAVFAELTASETNRARLFSIGNRLFVQADRLREIDMLLDRFLRSCDIAGEV